MVATGTNTVDMQNLNYKHLHYFWVVTKSGGVAKAGEQLHVTPQSISGQIKLLENAIGEPLWRRAGRKLELTETGHMVFDYADRYVQARQNLLAWMQDGSLKVWQDEFKGLEKAPAAFVDLLAGGNLGTRIVRVSD